MHQPWASLLVYGIKRIEGRSWPTAHRGRLWIAATAKTPLDIEVEEMEATYRNVHGVHDGPEELSITFPPSYPTGVLLGCVDIVDCLKVSSSCCCVAAQGLASMAVVAICLIAVAVQ